MTSEQDTDHQKTKVMAQGTFDIIHPGHIHYLRKSKENGSHLTVVLARTSNTDKNTLVFNDEERKKIVSSLKPVDKAILGSKKDKKRSLNKVKPDIITLGKDQDISTEKVSEMVENSKIRKDVEVKRISEKPGYSSSRIKQKLREH